MTDIHERIAVAACQLVDQIYHYEASSGELPFEAGDMQTLAGPVDHLDDLLAEAGYREPLPPLPMIHANFDGGGKAPEVVRLICPENPKEHPTESLTPSPDNGGLPIELGTHYGGSVLCPECKAVRRMEVEVP